MRVSRSIFTRALVLFCLFCVSAQTHTGLAGQNPAPDAAAATAARLDEAQDYIIGPDDKLDVRVFEQPEMGGKTRVSGQGFIRLPFVGQIKAAGYTESQLADAIREKLMSQLRDPQVSVFVEEHRNQQVSLIGFVRSPNRYEVTHGTRLLTLLAMAGGLADNAGNTAVIIRASSMAADQAEIDPRTPMSAGVELADLRRLLAGDRSANLLIYPGDVVSIPEADKIYVTGNVGSPGAFPLRGNLTLSQAVALAGGLKIGSSKSKVLIVRQDAATGQKTELIADLGQMEKNREEDLALKANDVIYVPSSAAKNFAISLITSLGVQSALLPLYMIRR